MKGDELGVSRETFGETQEGLGMEEDQYPKVPVPVRLLRAGRRLHALLECLLQTELAHLHGGGGAWAEESLSGRVVDPCARAEFNPLQRMCKVRRGGK